MRQEEKKLVEELLFAEKKKPSFAKQLYFGDFDAKQVFPYPLATPEEKRKEDLFVDQIESFASKNIDADKIDREAKIPDEVLQGLAKLNAFGMTVPKEYGGLGMTQRAYCRVVETLARHCSSTALFMNVHQSIGLKALLLFGTPEQKEKWLPPLAKGELYAAFSLTEPNAGSDANGVETRAIFDAEKNVYRINGTKQWTSNGSIAQVLTVMAKTEDDKVTAFLVTPDMPGFKVTDRSLEKGGMRGTWTANLKFEDMEVPAENILGPKGKGLKVALTVLDYGRTTFGSLCTGAAKFLIEQATNHAINRYQFKRPLASFGLVKKKIALMHALTYAMEATTFMTAGLIDSETEDVMLESAILKVFASDSLWSILYDTMQIFGGRSFFTSAPFERMMRDARLNQIGEGSNEVMRAFIGIVGMRDVGVEVKDVFEAIKHPFQDFQAFKSFAQHTLGHFTAPDIPITSHLLEDEAILLSTAVKRFGISVLRLLGKYKEDVIEQQLKLDRIATSAMCLYTTTAVLSKLNTSLEQVGGNPGPLGNDLAVGKFYCHHAMGVLNRHLDVLFKNDDDMMEKLSDQITGLPNEEA